MSKEKEKNVRHSTEIELVGADESVQILLWSNYFIKAQGYTSQQNNIYQDNKSTNILEKNVRSSILKRTKHIKARFCIKDNTKKEDIEVEHCLTERMWSDILNKLKQGNYFRLFRGE